MRRILAGVLVSVFFVSLFFITETGFCQTKEALLQRLNDLHMEYIEKRDEINYRMVTLRKDWHAKRDVLYQKLKDGEGDPEAIMKQLNDGASKIFEDKREINKQKLQYREDWLAERQKIYDQLKEME